jgi:uncharacterized protein GlcG (DUF336 family)
MFAARGRHLSLGLLRSRQLQQRQQQQFQSSSTSPTTLTLDIADRITTGVVDACKRNGFNPVVCIVLNPAAQAICSKAMDGSNLVAYPDFAFAKAYTALINKSSSRSFRDKYTVGDNAAAYCQMLSMVAISNNKMAPFPGGISVICTTTQEVIGSVGVSGASGDEDEYLALEGVKALSMYNVSCIPATHSCSTVKENQG